ncbi:PRC-barrel domain protein [Novosphingobium sp. PhB57]|nr:PRC-barrel domain protein [Novosphingobium sp. PhB57]
MADNQVATDETNRLIASNKVEGTSVYNRSGEKLGSIYNFMVDKPNVRDGAATTKVSKELSSALAFSISATSAANRSSSS